MLWSVLQEQFFCPITDEFFHSCQKMTFLLAGCCTSFATGWAVSLDGSNLRLMFRLLTVAFLPQFRSWRGVVVRASRSMPFSLVLPSACPSTGAVWWSVYRDLREPVLWSSAIAMGPQRAFLVMVGADELGESPCFIRDIQILAWGRCSQYHNRIGIYVWGTLPDVRPVLTKIGDEIDGFVRCTYQAGIRMQLNLHYIEYDTSKSYGRDVGLWTGVICWSKTYSCCYCTRSRLLGSFQPHAGVQIAQGKFSHSSFHWSLSFSGCLPWCIWADSWSLEIRHAVSLPFAKFFRVKMHCCCCL